MTHSAAALTWMLELGGIVFLAGSTISYFLLLSLKSTLKRYALAKPNARSSHKLPTPQGGGIAVIAATAAVTAGAAMCYPTLIGDSSKLAAVFVSVVALAAVGIQRRYSADRRVAAAIAPSRRCRVGVDDPA